MSISSFVNIILSTLIDSSIPHNILIADKGQTFYIIPRRHVDQDNLPINTCWNDLCGLVTYKEEDAFNQGEPEKILSEYVSLDDSLYEELTNSIMSKFDSIYIINKN
jgi:hypothetical protein